LPAAADATAVPWPSIKTPSGKSVQGLSAQFPAHGIRARGSSFSRSMPAITRLPPAVANSSCVARIPLSMT
jgi:hypothetical protein